MPGRRETELRGSGAQDVAHAPAIDVDVGMRPSLTRRGLLSAASFAGLGLLLTSCLPAPRGEGPGSGAGGAAPARPGRKLTIPPLLAGSAGANGARVFELTAQAGTSHILDGPPTPTWGYNGALLGPTLRAARGERVVVQVRNELPRTTTVHWHGMILPAAMDGGPHQPVAPGRSWSPEWTIDQPAATLWYHPHPHGETAMQVYAGLAGLFIIDDEHSADAGLPTNYGVDDIPLILQDKTFGDDGSLDPDRVPNFGIMGDVMLVNGTASAEFTATTSLVRFRILNGSNARMYNLEFSDGRAFDVVGGDAGLLEAPVEANRVSVSPAERVEIVVSLTAGEDVRLVTRNGRVDIDAGDHDLLRITSGDVSTSTAIPATLPAPAPIRPPSGAINRTFRLNGHDAINGEEMDMARIDTVLAAGSTEIWTIENTVYAHNFHIHGAAFTVLDVAGERPDASMRGHKDTVFVPPRSSARLAVRFADHPDSRTAYMYHCHILRHEDEGMMGQYVAVRAGTERSTPRTLGVSEDHAH